MLSRAALIAPITDDCCQLGQPEQTSCGDDAKLAQVPARRVACSQSFPGLRMFLGKPTRFALLRRLSAVVRERTDLHMGAGYPIKGFGDLVVVNVVRHVRP